MKKILWILPFSVVLFSPYVYAESEDSSSNSTSSSQEVTQIDQEISRKVESIKSEGDLEVPNRGDNDLFKTVVVDANKPQAPSSPKN